MNRIPNFLCTATLTLLAFASAFTMIFAQEIPPKNYAQHLIDVTLAKHREVITLALHVTPPDSPDNVIIASNFGRIGKKADEDDLRVIRTGQPNMEVNKAGDRFAVELPLLDVSHKTIGALAISFPYKVGDDKDKFRKRALKIRDEMRKSIRTTAQLMESVREK
jgi:hypothetical protein